MKNMVKLFKAMQSIAIIAIVAVIGFSMTGCKEDVQSDATTAGRLTITGLSAYNGQEIRGDATTASGLVLIACERAINETLASTGVTYGMAPPTPATITSGQVSLKVFVDKGYISGGGYHSYTGNDQNVQFGVGIGTSVGGVTSVNGTVTVNFSDGIATTGSFVAN